MFSKGTLTLAIALFASCLLPTTSQAADGPDPCPLNITIYYYGCISHGGDPASEFRTLCRQKFEKLYPSFDFVAEGGRAFFHDTGHSYCGHCYFCSRIGGPGDPYLMARRLEDALLTAEGATGGVATSATSAPRLDVDGVIVDEYLVDVRTSAGYTMQVLVNLDSGDVTVPSPPEEP